MLARSSFDAIQNKSLNWWLEDGLKMAIKDGLNYVPGVKIKDWISGSKIEKLKVNATKTIFPFIFMNKTSINNWWSVKS